MARKLKYKKHRTCCSMLVKQQQLSVYYSTEITQIGEVPCRNNGLMAQEQERGITITCCHFVSGISTTQACFYLRRHLITSILSIHGTRWLYSWSKLFAVVWWISFLFSAVDGVEPQSETNWDWSYRVPRIDC
jgi:elongation factor G